MIWQALTGKLKSYGLALLGVITGGLWLAARFYRNGRDKAREKVKRQQRQIEQAEARMQQREQAAKADRAGAAATGQKRRRAKQAAEQGKRDHFEGGWSMRTLVMILALALLAGCSLVPEREVYLTEPLPLPERPLLPTVAAGQWVDMERNGHPLVCLPPPQYADLADRDAALRGHVERLERIIRSTWKEGNVTSTD